MTISNTIESYRKRRRTPTPIIIGIVAVVLVLIGIVIVIISFSGGGLGKIFATDTPTPTITYTPTNTPMPTETATITPSPTNTETPTPAAPYAYVVQQGDYLYKIIADHGLGEESIILILMLNPYDAKTGTGIDPSTQNILVGETIMLPPPGMQVPTSTPWPTGITPGTRITYFVVPGDSLGLIARKCNSTIEAIVAANKTQLADGASTMIQPGWLLQVPVNLVTPVPTAAPTFTATGTP